MTVNLCSCFTQDNKLFCLRGITSKWAGTPYKSVQFSDKIHTGYKKYTRMRILETLGYTFYQYAILMPLIATDKLQIVLPFLPLFQLRSDLTEVGSPHARHVEKRRCHLVRNRVSFFINLSHEIRNMMHAYLHHPRIWISLFSKYIRRPFMMGAFE